MSMDGIANNVIFEQMTEIKVVEQAVWTQGKGK